MMQNKRALPNLLEANESKSYIAFIHTYICNESISHHKTIDDDGDQIVPLPGNSQKKIMCVVSWGSHSVRRTKKFRWVHKIYRGEQIKRAECSI